MPSRLRYNPSAARYIAPNGRFLSDASVRRIIDDDIDTAKQRMARASEEVKGLAQRYQDGKISDGEWKAGVIQWRDSFASEIKALHLGNYAAGQGGIHALTQSDYGRAGAAIREQYKALNGFVAEVAAAPAIALNTAKGKMPFMDRVGLYAEAGRGTYHVSQVQAKKKAGYQVMWNVLDDGANNCTGSNSCTFMSGLGKVALDEPQWTFPTFRKCHGRCRCDVEYGMDA